MAQSPVPYAPWDNDRPNPPPPLPIEAYERPSPEKTDIQRRAQPPLKISEQDNAPLSALEHLYKRRAGKSVLQFGYDTFNHEDDISSAPTGAVQDDYILGPGDELVVTFTGQKQAQITRKVTAQGTLTLPDMAPLQVTGRTISQVRKQLDTRISALHNTKAYLSLTAMRQISVLVVGDVKTPGRKTLSTFHTVLDALTKAGGIQKRGSLRAIKLIRRGKSQTIDLYDFLIHNENTPDITLRDGDRIIVPPIGPTVAVIGSVTRPRIYEIKNARQQLQIGAYSHNNSEISLKTLLNYAGGTFSAGKKRYIIQNLANSGQKTTQEVTPRSTALLKSGTILSVMDQNQKNQGSVTLAGHTQHAGLYDLSRHKTLSSLLKSEDVLGPNIYPLLGVVKRWDSTRLSHVFLPYSVRFVLESNFDLKLADNDVVYLLSNTYISDIYRKNNTDVKKDNTPPNNKDFLDIDLKTDLALKKFMKERQISLKGAVRKPGFYPAADQISLATLLASAGGTNFSADLSHIEITTNHIASPLYNISKNHNKITIINSEKTPLSTVLLSPGASVRVGQKENVLPKQSILITGEVLRPGEYDLIEGEKVSDILKRAGGLTEHAYPQGTIFSRKSERIREKRRFMAAAQDMQSRLAAAIERDAEAPNATQIKLVNDLSEKLNTIQSVGRITVETDPAILTVKPELDMLLEGGDRIYIPKRPLTVRVSGEILSPANLQFRTEKGPRDYIDEAGGFTYHADKSRTFVLFPDGSAKPLRVSSWNHTPVFVPPGSTIVVPRDPKPFDFLESAKEVGQILSNLAVTSVFIDDIRD